MLNSEVLYQDTNRLFVLEDFLERWTVLFQKEESTSFIIRGSLVLRQWVYPSQRIVKDLDILSLIPVDIDEQLRRISTAGEKSDRDDLTYHVSDMTYEATWLEQEFPGYKFQIPYTYKESRDVLSIDIGYGDSLTGGVEFLDYQKQDGKSISIPVPTIEVSLAWKVHGLFEHWQSGFRWTSKTLYDIHLILTHCEIDETLFQEAILEAFQETKTPLSVYNRIRNGKFGHSKSSARTWRRFIVQQGLSDWNMTHLDVLTLHRPFLDKFFGIL